MERLPRGISLWMQPVGHEGIDAFTLNVDIVDLELKRGPNDSLRIDSTI
jgi:hypothetical protein